MLQPLIKFFEISTVNDKIISLTKMTKFCQKACQQAMIDENVKIWPEGYHQKGLNFLPIGYGGQKCLKFQSYYDNYYDQ